MLPMLTTVLHVLVIVCALAALLKVKKTRMRHLPARRTRVSRHHGESTLWVERLINAVVDLFFYGAHDTAAPCTTTEHGTAEAADAHRIAIPAGVFAFFDLWKLGRDRAGMTDAASEMDWATRQPHHPFLTALEERVNAYLEDNGLATWAEFQIRALGERPPRVRVIRVACATPPHGENVRGAGAMESDTAIAQLPPRTSSPRPRPSPPRVTHLDVPPPYVRDSTFTNYKTTAHEEAQTPSSTTPRRWLDWRAWLHRAGLRLPRAKRTPRRDDGAQASATTRPLTGLPQRAMAAALGVSRRPPATARATPTVTSSTATTRLELEAELEYSGRLDVVLRAELALMRGRRLPLYARIGELRYCRVHLRATLDLSPDEGGSGGVVDCRVWLLSDPAFDVELHTTFSRLAITDFFLVPFIAKYALLRFVHAHLRRSGEGGLHLRIPLPTHLQPPETTSTASTP